MTTTDRPPIRGLLWLPGALISVLTLGVAFICAVMCANAADRGYAVKSLRDAAISLTLFAYVVTTCVGFWRKKRSTVPLMVGIGALGVAGVVLWELSKQHEPFPALVGWIEPPPFETGRIVVAAVLAVFWAAYFLNSKQVKATFTA